MKRILIFQHVAHEILGTFHSLLKNAGIRIRYVNFGRHPEMQVNVLDYEGLLILGGPMSVWEVERYPHLPHEIDCIRTAIAEGLPVLGICLGAQLIASALGAKVKRAKHSEIGWYDVQLTAAGKSDPLLSAFGEQEKIFQWHQDVFELPEGSTCLAFSKACKHQAICYGLKTYGFQFHLEVDQPMIERWLNLPSHKDVLGEGRADQIRSDTFQLADKNIELSRKVFSKYLALFSTKKKKLVLGSKPSQ